MKKILLVVIVLLFIGCSSKDKGDRNPAKCLADGFSGIVVTVHTPSGHRYDSVSWHHTTCSDGKMTTDEKYYITLDGYAAINDSNARDVSTYIPFGGK